MVGGIRMNATASKVTVIQYTAIFYNIAEAFLAVLFGLPARSTALIGFGLVSMVETLTDLTLIRRMKRLANGKFKPEPAVPAAILAFVLGSYILIQSIKELVLEEAPSPSLPGILITVFSLIFMPLLVFWSYKINHSLKTSLTLGMKYIWPYIFISLGLLLGLTLNYCFGIWQVDPAVGLITAVFLYKKSLQSILGGIRPDTTAD
jgi:divalent metal cation (Fe/Co/Zn/Cd) transporter